ncbi:MAG TPA: FAD-dependent oxidoreductase [Solirubrobacteraceae bacterium]|nr:FAD-dependent oxidoreductase [Solirubrobacteraceae bacterium]
MTTVAVLGGGVAGLSAAHELVERGFDVTVYEQRDAPGGKARSIPYAGSGTGGRADLPGEHGFRFFPGFYRHLPDTMGRIPLAGRTVRDHLVGATRILFAQAGGPNEIIAPAHLPESAEDFAVLARFLREAATQVGVPPQEYAVLIERLLTLLTSCDERREQQWDLQSWWDYTGAERRSAAFQRFLADGLTRTLVAARGREMSARTGGLVLIQLLQDLSRAGGRADRVLDAPTSEVWIDPWVEHLTARGVELRLSEPVEALHLGGGRVSGATVAGRTVRADHYVAALPVEVMRQLASPALRAAEPRLKGLDRLVTRWMNGVLFYLDRDIPLVNGHAIYVDSEWALTSISQKQFWPRVDLSQRGDGRTRGILSIDVSEWQRPGRRTGKVAQLCSREEIFEEVWAQLEDHLDGALGAATVVDRFLDPAIVFPNPTGAANLEPLLVNTAGSWADRPDAATRIPNLFLASDYVRTHTDLATMEAANEAARRAVNGILDATGSRERCEVWPLREPQVFAAARALDKARWKLFHRPPKPPLELTADGELRPTGVVARGLLGVGGLLRRLGR